MLWVDNIDVLSNDTFIKFYNHFNLMVTMEF